MQIRKHPENDCYEIAEDGERIGVLEYEERADDVIELESTVIDEEHRGRGVGTRLVRQALDDAADEGLGVVPTCPFVEAVIDRSPEYADLVVEAVGNGKPS